MAASGLGCTAIADFPGDKVHPAFRQGLILSIFTLVWLWAGMTYFDVESPYKAWFELQASGDKVKIGVWAAIGFMLAADAVWLVFYGLRKGRIR
jgi:hypothetical protein